MNQPFGIIFDDSLDNKILDNFFEIIRSSYVSKKANNNLFILSAPSDIKPQDIHKNIKLKSLETVDFIVVSFNNFYGTLGKDTFDWIEETFPHLKLVET